jgi:hypothetical protein
MPTLFAAGRCIAPLFIGPAERCVFIGRDEPIPNPVFAPALACTVEVIAARLTTGRAKVRGGGAADLIPALGPSIVARFGFTSSVCTGVILLSSFGETRIAFRATDCELTKVWRETAVNPFGARMFAYRILLCGP